MSMDEDLQFDEDLDFDDDSFEVDLDAGLPDEGDHYIKIKAGEFRRNLAKKDSRGVNFVLQFPDGQLYFDYVWLGNEEGPNRQGNQKLNSVHRAVTGVALEGKFSMKEFGPYKDKDGKIFFRTFDDVPVKVTVMHRRNKDTKILEPVFTYSSADD